MHTCALHFTMQSTVRYTLPCEVVHACMSQALRVAEHIVRARHYHSMLQSACAACACALLAGERHSLYSAAGSTLRLLAIDPFPSAMAHVAHRARAACLTPS